MDSQQFFIGIKGKRISVTEEVYLAYYRSKRRERYFERDIKTETAIRGKDGNVTGYAPSKEDSLDRLIDAGEDYDDGQKSVEDIVISCLMSNALYQALDKLPEADRELIEALFFANGGEGMSEREYADASGVPRKTIAYRRNRVLRRLKKIFEEN